MKPGIELDSLVAEKVMRESPRCGDYWHPSTDIAAAWEVVVKLSPIVNGFEFMIRWNGYTEKWQCGWFEAGFGDIEGRFTGDSESVPHAICLAALEAVGVEI